MDLRDLAQQAIVENPTSERWVFTDDELANFVRLVLEANTKTTWEWDSAPMVEQFNEFLRATEDYYQRHRHHDGLAYSEDEWEAFVWGWNMAQGRVAS